MAGPKELSFQILKEGHESLIQTSPKVFLELWTQDSRCMKDKYPFKICRKGWGERKEIIRYGHRHELGGSKQVVGEKELTRVA